MNIARARLPASLRTLHWLGVLFVLVGYLTGESMEDEAAASAAWHVLSGAGLLLLVVPRLWVHRRHRRELASAGAGWPERAARLGQWALLAFICVQPLLGVLALWSEGEAVPVPFTSWALASPFAGGFGDWPEELHETLGNLFYLVIGLHVAAALWHHFRLRDEVLRRML